MDLDNLKSYSTIDKENMLHIILRFPEALKEAYEKFTDIEFPKDIRIGKVSISYSYPSNVVICGMGGSAIGGDILKYWLMNEVPLHIDVIRDYVLPSYVNESTLVLVVSYSGNTEEALSCLNHALKKKSMVVTITSNGLLKRYSSMFGLPTFILPQGLPPRTALPYLFTAMAMALERSGINLHLSSNIDETFKVLSNLRDEINPEVPMEKNRAKQLAMKINGLFPIIHAYLAYYPAAFRFKTQLNENSKYPAECEALPEMNHNGIMGWEAHDIVHNLIAIFLIGGDEPKEISVRIEATSKIISDSGAEVIKITSTGIHRLSRLLSLVYLGDFTSYYLAIARGVDPTPVSSISRLKETLDVKLATKKRLEDAFKELLYAK